MLLELAIGDAYGAGFEYANEMVEKYNDLSHYIQHPRHFGVWPGRYTDDTQMSIAIAELIVEQCAWTTLEIATKFIEVFKRDPREGYSVRFYHFLQETNDGRNFLENINPDSEKSGAAMRATPIGIYPSIPEVIEKCTIQAAVTHNTENGIKAACAAALASHYFIYNLGPKAELQAFLESHLPGNMWSYTLPQKVKSKGWMSVRAAIIAVMRNDHTSTLLKDCVDFCGDVDTVATIALAAASCSNEYVNDLPQHLLDCLENGDYGREYLIDLNSKLFELKDH
jgi:ADP-ribosyl-[dinitrogen reductase] hydrolase